MKCACRTLLHDVGLTTGVLLLLTLGIGANVAVLSIVDSILLEPLPYRSPDRLVVVQEGVPDGGNAMGAVNAHHFLEWQRECDCFEDLALAEWISEVNLAGDGDPERVPSLRVTPNTFSLLGVSAQIGRTFVPEDAVLGENAPAPVVISGGLWERRFGGDPGVLGRTLRLDGIPAVVVGVLPPGFRPTRTVRTRAPTSTGRGISKPTPPYRGAAGTATTATTRSAACTTAYRPRRRSIDSTRSRPRLRPSASAKATRARSRAR